MSVKQVWVICGGVSTEHNISIKSARNVVNGLLQSNFAVHVVLIDRQGAWHYLDDMDSFLDINFDSTQLIQLSKQLSLVFGQKPVWRLLAEPNVVLPCDVVIPMVHGQQGEDGILQGVLRACDLPFVGADVMSSAICMSKRMTKQLLQQAGIKTAPWLIAYDASSVPDYASVCAALGNTVFVKPVSQGSSIGVARVVDEVGYHRAITEAFQFDQEVLIEQSVEAREIECSVLGNRYPRVALPGEIVCQSDFYSYKAKYVNQNDAQVVVPAKLTVEQIELIQQTALDVYRALACQGLARVDLFLTADNTVIVNEVNTIPGFTNISMYAKNWQASGLSFSDLLIELMDCAIEVYRRHQKIQTDYRALLVTGDVNYSN